MEGVQLVAVRLASLGRFFPDFLKGLGSLGVATGERPPSLSGQTGVAC